MIFKMKSIRSLFLVLVLSLYLFLGIGKNPSLAGTTPKTGSIFEKIITTSSNESVNLASGIDHFLTSMPSGYYTISSIDTLKKALTNPQTLLIDVREKSEYQSGHIPSAINIPLRTLSQNLDQIPRDRPVILSCSTGYRSAMGVTTLHLVGYENVKGFPASFMGWKNAGEAIAKS